uniref:EGF-like domain-containing protein n=1 Tax=Macrostomum lignano TaxID=282301 RepID=A0A1I8GJ22_9PLAT
MQHQRMLSLSLSILVVALNCSISISSLICENGGTFDSLNYECICTPNSYGIRCETLFVTSDPCADWKSKQVIHDSQAVHRLGNAMICGESPDLPCVDFSVIKADWYRLASPAGGQLVIGCPTGAIACGSQQAYFLVNETIKQEDNANRILLRARAYRYRPNLTGSCFLSGDTSYPVRILKCFSELTLYYLQPLPSFLNHYCIGSKAPCDAGLISVEGTGRDGNESLSCGFAMKNDRRKNKKVCIDMMLYNHDPDNRIPLGLTKGQQISIIKFQMPAIKDYSKRIQPTEILGICTCGKKELLTSNCFVSINNVKRDKRTAEAAPKEADEFCNTFVQLQLRRSVSTDICAQMKDPTGQADYISQFKLICAQYATVLGTFDSTQSLFNSMLGMCYTEMTYNASVVLGNSSKIEALVEDLCPSNCSGRGQCLSGECACMDGFWGPGCEFEIARRDEIPIEVELLQRSIFCSSDKCTAVYLSVKPLLRSTDSVCNIQLNSSLNYSTPSVYISGDIVKCELQEIHDSLFEDQRMFLLLQISLTAADWESSNSVSVLLHQAQCDGRPVTCDSDLLTCQAAGLQRENGGGGSECPPTLEKRGCLRLPTASLLVTVTVLIALINYY